MRIQQFDYTVNLTQSLLWQYNDALRLQSIIEQKQSWYDENQTQFWTDWYNNVFNLQTANDFGLSVWSIILGLPVFVAPNPDAPGKPIFGFGPNFKNFNNGSFANSGNPIVLPIEQRRLVLRLRYFQLTSRGAIPDTNFALNLVFNDAGLGNCWVLDGLDMSMTFVWTFAMPKPLLQVLKNFDLIPRPSGVKMKYVDGTRKNFGFGPNFENFTHGTFING